MQPAIHAVGLYFPASDPASLEALAAKAHGELDGLPPDRRSELEAKLREDLSGCALVEVLVTNADQRFSVSDFAQPDPSIDEGHWQVAWCESFLSADGEAAIACEPYEIPTEPSFRVVFYVHYWQGSLGLNSSYGPLALPSPQAVPRRLWALAPYDLVD